MIYCFDTYYLENKANTACVGIEDWDEKEVAFEAKEVLSDIAEYESGAFYKRELPCLLSLLEQIELNAATDVVVVDGYVVLNDEGKLGLGGYLFEALESNIPVVGVAKNNFVDLIHQKRSVYRGDSQKPLFVTAMGMDINEAAACVQSMHGEFRMPTILKEVDRRSRQIDH